VKLNVPLCAAIGFAVPHTVTSDDGTTFDSGTIPVGGTFRHTFTRAGTFPYHCNYHPYMRATISL
jgi:plastocyanin